ncbi:phage tail tape measure protein [Caproiciproducens galactitolivorans]|uniref:Phage-related minor tail protein n=1 Tax=Caproiciproducens galactitolivorans TaxID=642589 RepID=A0A4Z0Y669_9FIRM|nr:phage tail tape measure protein [Caproiciproducens galactitolivorans]QEY33878.1 phage tail tape measure protein [Caproiciproducens galactitolivorans]TGJ75388.1 phage-related minor tail protein [Caproiciproducens galactitolivorans]
MANNIKGITVEIGGDTVPLSSALKGVNKTAGDLQNELREVNKQLKFEPGSTELLTQKQTILAKEIETTKQKLSTLKEAQKDVEQQFQNGKLGEEKYRAFQREIEKTESQLKDLEKQAKQSNSVLGAQLQNTGKKISKAGEKISNVGQKLLPVTGAVVAIGTAAVKAGNDFEAQMSRVAAISGATGDDLKALTDQALQLGADTAYSATEAAQGMENLASAGFTTKEIMAAMPGMLDLAASSGEDLANSADIAASTLRGFGLAADQAGHVADVLAKNAADTNAAVADTGAAMKYIAPVAQNAGWSLEQVTAAIGEMADAGIKGEQAGTTLRGALTNLMNPSKEQAATMKEIGFSAYGANGKMKSLSEIIKELGEKTAGLTDKQRDNVIATIMGTNSLSGMQVLLKDGSANLDKLTASLKNSDGAAKQMASTMMDNTKGSIEQMNGAIETAAIKIQQILAPIITKIAEYIADLANKFSALSPGMQKIILIAVGIVAAIAPVAKVIQVTATGVKNLVGVIQAVGAATKDLFASPHVLLIAAIVAAIALLVVGIKHLWDTNEGFRTAVTSIWDGIKTVISNVVNTIVGFFTVTIPQAWNNFIAFVKQWGPTILAVVAPFLGIPLLIIQNWSQIKAFFSNLWISIQGTMAAAWVYIRAIAVNAWNSFVAFFTEIIPAFIESVGEWFQQLPYNIGYALGAAAAAVVNFGTDVWNWVTTELPEIIQGIVKWFSELPGNIWNFLKEVITNINTWGADMLQSATTWAMNTINSIGTWFSQLPGRIWTWLANTITHIGTWGTNIYNSAVTAARNTIGAVINWFSQLPGKIWSFLSNILASVGTWGTNMYNSTQTAVSNVVNGIIQWFSDLPNQMLKIGENIVKGIWDGINGAVGWLHDRISSFCDGILDGFKKNLKIHSPSRLFADVVGKNIALGIGQGFSDNIAAVVQSMTAAIPVFPDSGMQIRTAMAAAYGGYSASAKFGAGVTGSAPTASGPMGDIKVYQYFQGKVPSPAENARLTRNGLQQVVKKLR